MNTKHHYRLSLIVLLFIFSGWSHGVWAQNDTIVKAEATIATEPVMVYDATADRKSYTLDKRHQISIGYGILTPSHCSIIMPYLMEYIGTEPAYRYHGEFYGAFQIGYTFRCTKVIGVGLYYICDPRIVKLYNDQLIGKINWTTHTLLPTLKINWLNKRVVTMYSKVGFGISINQCGIKNYQPDHFEITPPQHRVYFAYQFTLVGIEIGENQYAGFLQLGAGMEGWFSVGLRIRL